MEVEMGQNLGIPRRELEGGTCVDAVHGDQRLSQGPIDNEDLTDLKKRKLKSLRAATRISSLDAIRDSVPCGNGDNPEDGRPVFETLHQMGTKLPILTNEEVPAGRLNPPAEPEDATMSKLDVNRVRASLEDHLNAHAQECLKLNEELKVVFQGLEHDLDEQKCLMLKKEHEVTALQREKQQQLYELIPQLHLRLSQVEERQDSVCEVRTELGQLRDNVNNQLSLLHIDIRKAFADQHCHNCEVPERLRRCQMLLESTTEDINLKTREGEELKETILTLEEANSKLEEKFDQIQQQLCKEKSGQHGSYLDGSQTPFLVESAAKTMFASISTFSNLLSRYKDSDGNNPVRTFICDNARRRQIMEGVRMARESHWKYLLKEFVCCQLFHNFETERFASDVHTVVFLDHEERVRKYFEYFKNYNLDKEVWHKAIFHEPSEKLDHLFFEYFVFRCVNLLPWEFKCDLSQTDDERIIGARIQKKILGLAPDKQKLVQSLIVAAGMVWQFHKLCLSFEPPATIFRVSSGDAFNPDYMESLDVPEEDGHGSVTVPKVGFMTYPGFRLRKSIVKCQVYLNTNIDT